MKKILFIAALLCIVTTIKAQDFFSDFSRDVARLAVRHTEAQVSDLLFEHYGVPRRTLNHLYNSYNRNWGEVAISLEICRELNIPLSRVYNSYDRHRGRGWGEIAKDLGVKPGSPEFHRMKKHFSDRDTYWSNTFRDYDRNRDSKVAYRGRRVLDGRLYSDFDNVKYSSDRSKHEKDKEYHGKPMKENHNKNHSEKHNRRK